MKLSDGVEWGTHVTTLLAVLPPDRALPAAKLAEYHGVPAAYLAKHLQALSRAGILESVQGPRGGYRLDRLACGIHRVMDDADAAWRASLREVTVAQLVDGVMRDATPAGLAAGARWI